MSDRSVMPSGFTQADAVPRAWLASLEDAGFGRAIHLLCERGGRVVACLPGLLSSLGPLRLFGSPLQGWQTSSMGPAFDPDRVSTEAIFSAVLPAEVLP